MLSDITFLIYGRRYPPPHGRPAIFLTGLMLNVLRIKPIRRKNKGISLEELRNGLDIRIDCIFANQRALAEVLRKYIDKLIDVDACIAYFVLVALRQLRDDLFYTTSCEFALKQNLIRMPFPSEDDELQSVYKLPFLLTNTLQPLPFDLHSVLTERLWVIDEMEPESPPKSVPWDENGRLTDSFKKLIFDDSLRVIDQNILNSSEVNISILSFTKQEVIQNLMFLYTGISSELFNAQEQNSGFILPSFVEVRDQMGFGIKFSHSMLQMHLELGNKLMDTKKKFLAQYCVGCDEVFRNAVLDEMEMFSSFLAQQITDLSTFYEKLTQIIHYVTNFLGFVGICEKLLREQLSATEVSTFLQFNLATSLEFVNDIASRVLRKVNIHIVKSLYLFTEKGLINFDEGVISNKENGSYFVSVSNSEILFIKPTVLISENLCSNILWYGAIMKEIAHDNNLRYPELYELQKNVRDSNTFIGQFLKDFLAEHETRILDLTYIFEVFSRKNSQSKLFSYMRNEVKIAANIMYKLFLHRCQVSERKVLGSVQYFCPDLPSEYQSAISAGGTDGRRLAVTLSKIVSVVITEKHQHGYEIIGEGLQKIFSGFDAIIHLSTRNHYLLPGEDRRAFYYKHVMDRVLSNLISHTYQTVNPLWETFNMELDNADSVTAMIDSHRRFIREVRTNTIFHIVFTNKAFSFVTKMCESCILFATAFNQGDSMTLQNHYQEFRANLDLLLDVLETGDFKFQPLCAMLGRFVLSKSKNYIK
ncbi:unnamed protein product [Auanema sp. JU1783]|nr:unnamed protein product [Auanema sp. JU1783]